MDLAYRVAFTDRNYLDVELSADKGPMSTSHFLISLEAIPIGSTQSFIHLTYSYSLGMSGSLATKAYLASAGRNKVGFTQTGGTKQSPNYIDGIRGMVERNTMRYYLAIDTYLGSLNDPPGKRLQNWFAATERYPRQLQGISRNAYLNMKQTELRRMGQI